MAPIVGVARRVRASARLALSEAMLRNRYGLFPAAPRANRRSRPAHLLPQTARSPTTRAARNPEGSGAAPEGRAPPVPEC